jgi:hypothetical protein
MMPNRIEPALPSRAYQTFQVTTPRSTHFEDATCEQVNCPMAVSGWASLIDEATALGQKQAHYIRRSSGRRFVEEKSPEGLTRFVFPGGQDCFQSHQVRIERPSIYMVRSGDYRNLGRPRVHSRPEFWVEEFAEQTAKIRDLQNRG